MFSWNSFDSFPNLSREFRMELVRASNNSLTKATWASYRTAERHIARCRRQTGWSLTLPLDKEDLLTRVSHMEAPIVVQKVKIIRQNLKIQPTSIPEEAPNGSSLKISLQRSSK